MHPFARVSSRPSALSHLDVIKGIGSCRPLGVEAPSLYVVRCLKTVCRGHQVEPAAACSVVAGKTVRHMELAKTWKAAQSDAYARRVDRSAKSAARNCTSVLAAPGDARGVDQ